MARIQLEGRSVVVDCFPVPTLVLQEIGVVVVHLGIMGQSLNSRPEQGLSRQPNFILFYGFPREEQQQQHSGHSQGGGPTAMQTSAELAQSVHKQDAVAHARHVKDSLGHHKAHPEEEIAGWDERANQEQQAH